MKELGHKTCRAPSASSIMLGVGPWGVGGVGVEGVRMMSGEKVAVHIFLL